MSGVKELILLLSIVALPFGALAAGIAYSRAGDKAWCHEQGYAKTREIGNAIVCVRPDGALVQVDR